MNPLSELRRLVPWLIGMSLMTNLAILVSPIFMMQVLDRVVPTGNVNSLILLGALALGALCLQGAFIYIRDRVLGGAARWVERVATDLAISGQAGNEDTIQQAGAFMQFLSGPAAVAAFDLPWMPLFVIALYLLHPSFVVLLVVLFVIGVIAERVIRISGDQFESKALALSRREQQHLSQAALCRDQTGSLILSQNLFERYKQLRDQRHDALERRQIGASLHLALSGWMRMAAQILALAFGAYLLGLGYLSAGGMIAGSIILAKSYSIAEALGRQLPAILENLANYRILCALGAEQAPPRTELASFSGRLEVDNLTIPRGAGAPPILERISFSLESGECLAIIGASGSGKTRLLSAMAGIAPAPIGSCRYDDADVRSLSPESQYQTIGYLPQQANLLPGTIAENIICFSQTRDDRAIVDAATRAGVHGLICTLPNGYDTDLSSVPHVLSAGQGQRVALARAIYSKPRYLFLDEPNALLDGEGERALASTLARLKNAGTTIVMVLHRAGIMGLADKVLRLEQGRIADSGPRSEVLGRLQSRKAQIDLPLAPHSLQDLTDWIASQFLRSTDLEFSHKAQLIASELFSLVMARAHGMAKVAFKFESTQSCVISCEVNQNGEALVRSLDLAQRTDQHPEGHAQYSVDDMALMIIQDMTHSFDINAAGESAQITVSLRADQADSKTNPQVLN